MNSRLLGTEYEKKAALLLKDNGVLILEQNFRIRNGEIDIIAQDGKYLIFVEVKYRSNDSFGTATQAVGKKKIERIKNTARYYLHMHHYSGTVPVRFDVLGITGTNIEWIRNAF